MSKNSALINPVAITAYSTFSACGLGNQALSEALKNNQTFLKPLTLFDVKFPTFVGEIKHTLAQIRPELEAYQSRNAQVALTALNFEPDGLRVAIETAKARYGTERIGVIIGTSTSGLYETESAYGFLLEHGDMPDDFHFVTRHAYQATGRFLQLELGLTGICFAISTACSSGAKAIAAGQRLINNGVCDAVLVGGVDTLCRLTLRGFSSLELVSPNPCTPMDKNRTGINIGEAAGLLLLEKSTADNQHCLQLLSVGESSDAHHMSHPHPEGLGAALAMQQALDFAGITANQVDYLNLHATATKINDAVEAGAVYSVFGNHVPCSGTKGITGHTLGAAGALETIITVQALEHSMVPATTGLTEVDDDCLCQVVANPIVNQNIHVAMSNSFGFGGNNASVIVAKPSHDFQSFKGLEVIEQKTVFIKSAVICCPDSELLKPFGLESVEVDKNLIPAAMRRRTSLTTRMAITAATQACIEAQVDPSILPSVFASLGGEIQVTDALCRLLPNPDELLSPTQFHNSVHNTTAGYWGILNHCQAPTTAIAAVDDGFAMGLLEAWSQLQQASGDILLVCYDEEWPQYLAAPIGKVALACALVLSTNDDVKMAACSVPQQIGTLEKPLDTAWSELVKAVPAAAAIPLLQALKNRQSGLISLNIQHALWQTYLQI